MARAGGLGGEPSSATIPLWMAFISNPTRRTWYRAHNASIVAAYLEHRELAEAENEPERFFLNVVLLRMLYAHALVAAPGLALRWLAPIGPPLGDPRLAMTGIFLSLSRILPDRYPLQREVDEYIREEHWFGRLLDYGIIQPRLQPLYEWSAQTLQQPGLLDSSTMATLSTPGHTKSRMSGLRSRNLERFAWCSGCCRLVVRVRSPESEVRGGRSPRSEVRSPS